MADYKVTIPFILPGLNEYTQYNRWNKYLGAKLKKELEDNLQLVIKNQLIGVKINPPVYMEYLWVEKDMRRDADNIAFAKKFIQDALVKAGVLENDSRKYIKRFSDDFVEDNKNPRIEIKIFEI